MLGKKSRFVKDKLKKSRTQDILLSYIDISAALNLKQFCVCHQIETSLALIFSLLRC